jgi:hypothetical protein
MGVSGANLYAPSGQARFITEDFDLFLPLDVDNLVAAWEACADVGLDIWLGADPLEKPRDSWLAERIVDRRAVTRVTGPGDLQVDLSLVMEGFAFEEVWKQRRTFPIEGVDIPTARLTQIVESKQSAGRQKDQLFLTTHKDALEQLLTKLDPPLPKRPAD